MFEVTKLPFAPEYFISSTGDIYKLIAGRSEFLTQNISNGYAVVKIRNKKYFVHKLVAEMFVPGKTLLKNKVIHLDTNNLNNNLWNLKWVTASEAQLYSRLTVDKRKELNFR